MKRWYVVHTHPNAEARALMHLERQSFVAWLPLYRKTRRHAGRTEKVLRPLFARYLFVRLDLDAERWRPVLSTIGVHHLVGDGRGPRAVADKVVAALRARADDEGLFDIAAAQTLHEGDRVRISAGPLAELEGIFQTTTDAQRVAILLSLLGRDVRVHVAASDVEAS